MALGEIVLGAHLFEAADRAVELEAPVAAFVEVAGLRIGGGEELDLVLVQRVDQRDEARGLVAVLGAKLGDADEDDGVNFRAMAR